MLNKYFQDQRSSIHNIYPVSELNEDPFLDKMRTNACLYKSNQIYDFTLQILIFTQFLMSVPYSSLSSSTDYQLYVSLNIHSFIH